MENFSLPIHGDVYLEDIHRCILIVYIIGQPINNINCGVYCVYELYGASQRRILNVYIIG